MQTGYEVGSLMWLRASQFISLQPIIPAQVTVMVTGLFFFFFFSKGTYFQSLANKTDL